MTTASPYNNPLFAQGLSGLVGQFIGDPGQEAANQLNASQALLNNQTAQYRDAIGDTGMGGDLSGMMVRALQAGPAYAAQAPTIGENALRFGAVGYGDGAYVEPQADAAMGEMAGLAQMMAQATRAPSRSGGSSTSPSRPLTQAERNRVNTTVKNFELDGYEMTAQDRVKINAAIMQRYASGNFASLDEAAIDVLSGLATEEVVDDPWGPFNKTTTINMTGLDAPATPATPATPTTDDLDDVELLQRYLNQ